jgi:hypothetical protein
MRCGMFPFPFETRAVEFWRASDSWPRDPVGYVFFARGFLAIGAMKFGDAWRGNECTLGEEFVDDQIERLSRNAMRQRSLSSAGGSFPLTSNRKPSELPAELRRLFSVTAEETASFRPMDRKAHQDALRRRQVVRDSIITACEAGSLVAAIRPKHGGLMRTLPPSFWNGEVDQRFVWCEMHPMNPFSPAIGGDSFEYLFFEAQSLNDFLNERSLEPTTPARLSDQQCLGAQVGGRSKREREEAEYKAYVTLHADEKKRSRHKDLEHMRGVFPKIARDRVWQLRGVFAPAEWRSGGRPKSDPKPDGECGG